MMVRSAIVAVALTRFRITFTVHTSAFLLTIVTIIALVAALFAFVTAKAGLAQAFAVNRRATGTIMTITGRRTVLAKRQIRTVSIANGSTPTSLAVTAAIQRMAQLCVVLHALAQERAPFTIQIVTTRAIIARIALPSTQAIASAIDRITFRVLCVAFAWLGAILSEQMVRTRVQTLGAHVAGRTDTFAGHMMAVAIVIAFALILAI